MSDEEWAFLAPLLTPKDRRGYRPAGHRRTLDAIFAVCTSHGHWRELPADAGKWNSVYRQFQRWSQVGLWDGIAAALGSTHRPRQMPRPLARKPAGRCRRELEVKLAAVRQLAQATQRNKPGRRSG